MYPTQFRLRALTEHLVALFERRRGAFSQWDEAVEKALLREAEAALDEAGAQFATVADDPGYWARVRKALLTVAVPRYFRLAAEQQALEKRRYGLWRGGDLLARAAYAGAGVVLGVIIWRTPIPDWLEVLPLVLFVLGPLIPDGQVWLHQRSYRGKLDKLAQDMDDEQQQMMTYRDYALPETVAAAPVERIDEPSTPTSLSPAELKKERP